jgi:trehalose 6-phosphate phosphatase
VSSSPISSSLGRALIDFACRDSVLIALDFDGTLAPLVDDPEESRMIPEARNALEALSSLEGVSIALVSGRSVDSLLRVADPLPSWFLVGSHGIEVVSPEHRAAYQTLWLVPGGLKEKFESVVREHPGTRLEYKPFGLALHTRGVDENVAQSAAKAAHSLCDSWGGDLLVRTGHGIVECSIQEATKGDGLKELITRIKPTATLFAGDDTTDEDGFAILGPSDVSIRVGGGESRASHQLSDAAAVADALWVIQGSRVGAKDSL